MVGPTSRQILIARTWTLPRYTCTRCVPLLPVLSFKRMIVIIAQAEREAVMSEVRIADIVLYHDPGVGRQIPAMIVKRESQERVWLNVCTIDGRMALDTPKPCGDQPGQREPRPRG